MAVTEAERFTLVAWHATRTRTAKEREKEWGEVEGGSAGASSTQFLTMFAIELFTLRLCIALDLRLGHDRLLLFLLCSLLNFLLKCNKFHN